MANLFRCAGAGGEDIKCIERPYNSNDIYNTGDTAMYNGLLRICTADGVTGEFDVSKWEVTTLDELLGENIGENDALVDYIASEYDPTHTYAAGDAILGDNGEILKCLEDDVTGEFDNSKWSRDYLCNLSGNVNSNLTSNNITVIAQPQDDDSTSVGRRPTVTIDLERNGIYLIASGIAYNQTQDITITSNSGSFDVLVHENRIPNARTSSGGSNGVYFYIIQAGADGANVTIQGTSYTIFSVYKISC